MPHEIDGISERTLTIAGSLQSRHSQHCLQHKMDNPMIDVSQETQQNDQLEGHLLVRGRSLSVPHEVGEAKVRHITAEVQLQQPSHPQQEEKQQKDPKALFHQEQQQEDPEAVFHQEQQVEDNQELQGNSGEQIKEKCIHPENEKHLEESHKFQMQHNQELQTQEIKELQTQHHHQKVQTQLSQELKTKIKVQDLQTQKSQELQAQPRQERQIQEKQEMHKHQNQELQMHHHKEQQTQHISTAPQAHLSLSGLGQHQEKKPIQNHPKKHQLTDKDLQQRQQEQHCKKLKKKLVGENQERINYLVQASRAVALTTGSPAAIPGQKALAAQVGSLASAVGRRCVLRLAPGLKRCLCKGCGTSLVYGVNARVRHRSHRQKHLVVTCLTCHTIKRFVSDPKHNLWFEREEAVV